MLVGLAIVGKDSGHSACTMKVLVAFPILGCQLLLQSNWRVSSSISIVAISVANPLAVDWKSGVDKAALSALSYIIFALARSICIGWELMYMTIQIQRYDVFPRGNHTLKKIKLHREIT